MHLKHYHCHHLPLRPTTIRVYQVLTPLISYRWNETPAVFQQYKGQALFTEISVFSKTLSAHLTESPVPQIQRWLISSSHTFTWVLVPPYHVGTEWGVNLLPPLFLGFSPGRLRLF